MRHISAVVANATRVAALLAAPNPAFANASPVTTTGSPSATMKNCRNRSATCSSETTTSSRCSPLRPSRGVGKPSAFPTYSTAAAVIHSAPRTQPGWKAPAIQNTADTPTQNSSRTALRCPSWPRNRRIATAKMPSRTTTYTPAKTRPRRPNASGTAAASTSVPNMIDMTTSWISGCRGSNVSVNLVAATQTNNTADSNTSVWNAPVQLRCSSRSCESRKNARTNTRSRNSSRNPARPCSGLRSSLLALPVVISRPFLPFLSVLTLVGPSCWAAKVADKDAADNDYRSGQPAGLRIR